MRILIIEDNEAVRSAIRRALTARGHEIVEAATAAEGRVAVTDALDAIVLDVNLPDGSGFDVCRTLRETGVRSPAARSPIQARPTTSSRSPASASTSPRTPSAATAPHST